jgi:hypothetical protein
VHWCGIAGAAIALAILAGCSGTSVESTAESGDPTQSAGTDSSAQSSPTDPTAGGSDGGDPGGSDDPGGQGTQATALPTLPPVELDQEADFGDGVTARVTGVRAVDAEASGAGEIGGPALAFTIELDNRTTEQLPLDTVTVLMVYGGADTPAIPILGDPRARPFSGRLEPDAAKSGVYIFTVPEDGRDDVTLTVSHASLSPIVAFQGSAPG